LGGLFKNAVAVVVKYAGRNATCAYTIWSFSWNI